MRENFKSGSMRGGWPGMTPCLGDLSTAGKPSENARQTTGSAEPVAYSTFGLTHMPTPTATTTGGARCFSGYTDPPNQGLRVA
jgi:hypothetical protein